MQLSQARLGAAISLGVLAQPAEDAAYAEACQRIARARPYLAERAPAQALLPIPERSLLHAGPPVDAPAALSPRLRAAAIAAIRREGLAESDAEAARALETGDVALHPAQDFGIVTPLDHVIGRRSELLRVADRAGVGVDCFAPAVEANGFAIGDAIPLAAALPDGAVLAAIKCAVGAAGHIHGCPVVTDLGSNGRDLGLKLSGRPTVWISTAGFWFRRRHRVLRRVDDGVLALGDGLVRLLLSTGRSAQARPLNAAEPLNAVSALLPPLLRAIPAGLFSAALARCNQAHWTVFVQPF